MIDRRRRQRADAAPLAAARAARARALRATPRKRSRTRELRARFGVDACGAAAGGGRPVGARPAHRLVVHVRRSARRRRARTAKRATWSTSPATRSPASGRSRPRARSVDARASSERDKWASDRQDGRGHRDVLIAGFAALVLGDHRRGAAGAATCAPPNGSAPSRLAGALLSLLNAWPMQSMQLRTAEPVASQIAMLAIGARRRCAARRAAVRPDVGHRRVVRAERRARAARGASSAVGRRRGGGRGRRGHRSGADGARPARDRRCGRRSPANRCGRRSPARCWERWASSRYRACRSSCCTCRLADARLDAPCRGSGSGSSCCCNAPRRCRNPVSR